MRKNCNTCKHRDEIGNSHRISCSFYLKNKNKISESPLHAISIPEYAKESGWVNFPYDFDPLWIISSDCNGHSYKVEDDILIGFV